MDNNVSYNNTEGENEIELLKTIIKDDSIVFDVGARDSNLPLINNNATYYLFEPIKWNYERLNQRFFDYKNVNIITEGLSDIKEETSIYLESESIHKRFNFNYIWNIVKPDRVANGETEKINCNTLKKFIDDNNISRIDVLKIDVEGYEYKVLKGLYEHMNMVQHILFEYSIGTYTSSNVTLMDVLKLLTEFDIYLINDKNLENLGSDLDIIYGRLYPINNCMIYAKRR